MEETGRAVQAVRAALFECQDIPYREFQAKLIPGIDPASMIGVRTPDARRIAKDLMKREDAEDFLRDLPHRYFDENQVHAFALSGIRDFETCLGEVEAFLPFVDNWATCDQMSPGVFKKNKKALAVRIRTWLTADHPYTVRFALGMLMQHYLDQDFDPEGLALAAGIHREEYYINMMIAWYFATALAKQEEAALPYLEEKRLDPWIHNKTIQKAVESRRISDEKKALLRSLKVPAR